MYKIKLKSITMKKLALCAVVLSGLALTSCSKKKDCSCESDIAGIKSTSVVTIESGKCEDMDSETTAFGITTSTKCTKE